MEKIDTTIFIIPVVALLLVFILYLHHLRKTPSQDAFKRYSVCILIIGFLLNLIWEVAQMPLYETGTDTLSSLAFCALASVADALMVLLLYYLIAYAASNSFWIARVSGWQAVAIMLTGGAGAILAELRHLSAGSWSYSQLMPLIPILKVGLSPVLQFMILPMLVYYLSFKLVQRSNQMIFN